MERAKSKVPNLMPAGGRLPRGPVLALERLRKSFGGQMVLDCISGQVHAGEVVLLRGDNGSGKTTLLNVLTGCLEPDEGLIKLEVDGHREAFSFPRTPFRRLNPFDHFTPERLAWEGVGRTWQDIRLFRSQTLLENICVARPGQVGERPLAVLFRGGLIRKQEAENRRTAAELLQSIGLGGREGSSSDRVSLGQAKRAAILRALNSGARILFLDEPLSGLDSTGRTEVIGLLRDLASRGEVTLLIVEHMVNIPLVLDVATTVWTLGGGALEVESVESARRTPIGKSEADQWLSWGLNPLRTVELPRGAVLSILQRHGDGPGRPLLEVEALSVRRGSRTVLGHDADHPISFSLEAGQIGLLEAPNGWGKTTLLEAIAGLVPTAGGQTRVNDREVTGLPPWERTNLGLSFLQSRNNTFPSLRVADALRLAHVQDTPDGLETLARRRVGSLSGGERQRVAVACALQPTRALVYLLDEPFAALDERGTSLVIHRILQSSPLAAILVAVPRLTS